MPGPSEFKAPVLSDSELSNMKLPSLKKVSKQIVHAMRFMKPQDSENEPSTIDRQCHVFSDAKADGHQLAKEFDSHPKHNLYLQGLAFEKSQNFPLARDFYELAREGPTQHPSACARLWDFFQFGRPGIPLNFDRAYDCAKSGARSSCAHCTGALSLHMAFGWGMSAQDRCSGIEKIDVPQAVRLATASAQEDSAYGHYALATFYFGGIGVVQSDKNMFSMYSKAALQGLGRAKLALGSCFMHGIGVHMNLRLAAMHFEDASTSGVLGAALLLQNVIDRFDEQMN